MRSANALRSVVVAIVLTLVLAACGGGGATPIASNSSSSSNQSSAKSQAAPSALATQPMPTQSAATQTPAPSASATPGLVSAPSKSAGEVIAAVKAAQAATEKATGPRLVTVTVYQGDTAISVIEAQFVPPDTLHQQVKMGGQVMAESYWYQGTIYTKAPNTGGWKSSPGALKQFTQVLGGMAGSLADSIIYSDGKVLGVETVKGEPATVYSYSTQLQGLPDKVPHKVWVSNATGLPVKEETDKEGEKTVREITYNAAIIISVPAEVLSAPAATE
ncbi:MAG TPA: hypothetical protein VLG46_16540 [Anaerolineae bacterium]|nr:hypothetical protein [Anaerolineae bacterium]